MHHAKVVIAETTPGFIAHLDHCIAPQLQENYNTAQIPSFPSLRMWTNNNCESLNHILNMAINWQPRAPGELVEKLYSTVCSQYKELQCSIVGLGDFQLCEEYKQFSVLETVWSRKEQGQRE